MPMPPRASGLTIRSRPSTSWPTKLGPDPDSGATSLAGTSPEIIVHAAARMRKSDDERALRRRRAHFTGKSVLRVLAELTTSRGDVPSGQRRAGDDDAGARAETAV